MAADAKERATMLYESIDGNNLLINNIAKESRSSINVVFDCSKASHLEHILAQAQQQGLAGLEGHRSVGGIRASMYNGTPIEAVNVLNKIIQNLG